MTFQYCLILAVLLCAREHMTEAFKPLSLRKVMSRPDTILRMCEAGEGTDPEAAPEAEIEDLSDFVPESDEISRLSQRIEQLNSEIEAVTALYATEEGELLAMDDEFGPEIERVKSEFARIRERAVEESKELSDKAKADALKEVLPITDNYMRAKTIFEPCDGESAEGKILASYDEVFASFAKVLEGFGLERVESLGKPFDYNYMEAIMQQPSTEYEEGVVCTEYQVGYRMGDKCIRPAMVVVSSG